MKVSNGPKREFLNWNEKCTVSSNIGTELLRCLKKKETEMLQSIFQCSKQIKLRYVEVSWALRNPTTRAIKDSSAEEKLRKLFDENFDLGIEPMMQMASVDMNLDGKLQRATLSRLIGLSISNPVGMQA